jgi:hypothetical protein
MLLPIGKSPEDGKPGLLLALPLAPFKVVVPRLATNGAFALPPHPAASTERPARRPANGTQRALEVDIV